MPCKAVGVVVVVETPYAEGFGDVGGPKWAHDPGEHISRGRCRPCSCPTRTPTRSRRSAPQAAACTVLVVSGRPLIIPPDLLTQIDALVASWLPGSEGAGVADVLYGSARSPASCR